MSEWKENKIGELISLEYGKGLTGYKDAIGEYEVFGTNGKIGYTDQFIYDKPSIIIGRKGAYRGVNLAVKPFFVIDTAFYSKNKIKDIDTPFLFYWFKNIDIDEMDSGSAIPSTSRDEVYDLDISLPPLSEQKAIAGVLSSLDDKIDLLHRQNKTLEAMAETLFRQWFVISNGDDSNVIKFIDAVQFTKGRKPQETSELYIDGLIPQILIETFDTGKTLFSDPINMVIAKEKDILMVMDGASSGRVEIGFEGIVGSTIGLFRPKEEFNYPLFLYHFLKYNEEYIKDNTTGSAIPHADKDLILDLDVEYLSGKVEQFEKITSGFFKKKQNNNKQILSLVKLRDTLLPKLMSGQVRIRYEEN